jgi:small subunit ribosomal protein S20
MANTKSAAKRARQTKTRTLRNRRVLSALKTEQKRMATHLTSANKDDAPLTRATYQNLVSELDKAAKRGVIHQNVADRRKSRLARKLAAPAAAAVSA